MKNGMKRLFSLSLAMLMLLSVGTQCAWADWQTDRGEAVEASLSTQSAKSAAKIAVDSVKAKAGQTVIVPVKISRNPGIAGVALEFHLSKGLKLKNITAGKAYRDGILTRNGTTVSWFGADNVKKNGTLFTLTVTTPNKAGTYKIKAALKDGKSGNLCDEDGDTVKVKFSAGAVKVSVSKTAAKLTAPEWKSVTSGKGRITVIWKRNTTGKGYELQYSTDKAFKKGVKMVKIGGNAVTKKTLNGLKKEKTYYVRIRSVIGKNNSEWSAVKKVKTGV